MDVERTASRVTLWTGLIAVAAGVILLLDHLGVLHAGYVFRFWPVMLIAIGINLLCKREGKQGSMIGAVLLTLCGILLLAVNFHRLTWMQAWPLALIAAGLVLVWQSFQPDRCSFGLSSLGKLHPTSVFGAVQRSITDRDYQQGKAETVFGSIELDFIYADIAGEKAYLDVAIVFGSVEVRVPPSWNVSVETTAVFGTAENKTRAAVPTAVPKLLIVRGDIVFGSLEIKN